MKLFLINVVLTIIFLSNGPAVAKNFNTEYTVSSSGIKIGKFSWSLEINNKNYKTEIFLKNSGIFSPLYKFEGNYTSQGVIENNNYKAEKYRQYWKTKKKVKVVEMLFDDYLKKLSQKPEEKELARVGLDELFQYFDPLTSFLNVLNGDDQVKTIDGRRIYTMKRVGLDDTENITLEIKNYKNIWADHKRNDLKKIEFILEGESFLPKNINIYFKNRVFKLKKN